MKNIKIYQTLLIVATVIIAVLVTWIFADCKNPQGEKHANTVNVAADSGKVNSVKTGNWKKISPQEIKNNPVTLCENLLALASGKEGDMNAMTIGWMTMGWLWSDPVAVVYVSPDRYTFEFMENNEYFTITAFPKEDREKLMFIGTHSGRDGDKIKDAGLTVEYTELGNPTFTNGTLMIECRKIYSDPIDSSVMDKDIRKKFYEDYKQTVHHLFVGKIVNVWIKE